MWIKCVNLKYTAQEIFMRWASLYNPHPGEKRGYFLPPQCLPPDHHDCFEASQTEFTLAGAPVYVSPCLILYLSKYITHIACGWSDFIPSDYWFSAGLILVPYRMGWRWWCLDFIVFTTGLGKRLLLTILQPKQELSGTKHNQYLAEDTSQ